MNFHKNPLSNRFVTADQISAYNTARLTELRSRTYQTGPRAGSALAERTNLAALARELGVA